MVTNCVNCGAIIDRKLDKCPYCDTPYEYNGFSADFENKPHLGTIRIAGKEYQVYLGDCEVSAIGMGRYRDINGTLHGENTVRKREFTLIEV